MMADARPGSSARRTRPPLWVVEGLDVVERRRLVLLAVTATIVVVGALLAWLAPGIVPPRASVGAAIAVAALLLGLAAAVAVDATDLYIRGPRHVSAAGGELVAVLSQSATPDEAVPLAAAVFEAREPGEPLLLGLAASGKDSRVTVAWTDALATALEAEGASVLRIDLASGASEPPGLAEVVHDGVKLAGAVTFGPEPRLARLGAGADHAAALDALTTLPGRLPRDLEVLLVALPMAASRQVVGAVRSLDHVLIVAQRDRTSRVELIAGLDALEAAGTRAQVALVDERTAARLGAGVERSDEQPTSSVGFTAKSPSGGEAAAAPGGGASADAGLEDDGSAEAAPGDDRSGAEVAGTGTAAEGDSAESAAELAYDEIITPSAEDDEFATPPAEDDGFATPPAEDVIDPGTPADSGAGSSVMDQTDRTDATAPTQVDTAPGGDDVASDARSADVLNAAAAAAALAQVASAEAPVPARFTHDSPNEPPATESTDGRDQTGAGDADGAGPDSPDDAPGDANRTDEIPRLDGSPPVRRVDDEHDDLLRTTAQLSVLMDDLDDQRR